MWSWIGPTTSTTRCTACAACAASATTSSGISCLSTRSLIRRSGDQGFYTMERRPRVISTQQRRHGGPRSSYLGSEVYVTLTDPSGPEMSAAAAPDRRCDVQQSRPAAAHAARRRPQPLRRRQRRTARQDHLHRRADPAPPALARGRASWQLINHLALNYRSIVDDTRWRRRGRAARAAGALSACVRGQQRARRRRARGEQAGRPSPAGAGPDHLRPRPRDRASARGAEPARPQSVLAGRRARAILRQIRDPQQLHRNRSDHARTWRDHAMADPTRQPALCCRSSARRRTVPVRVPAGAPPVGAGACARAAPRSGAPGGPGAGQGRSGALSGVSAGQSVGVRAGRSDDAGSPLGALFRAVRSTGTAADPSDRICQASAGAGARPDVRTICRHLSPSPAAAVLPRLGGCAAGGRP